MVISIKILKNDELDNIKGGSATVIWVGLAITAVIVFASGLIEGITNPERCNAE